VKAYVMVKGLRLTAALHILSARSASTISELDRGRPGNRRGDHGATSVEYALMAGLIAVVIVAAVTLFGRNVSSLFNVPSSVFSP
jgi:Flp pilus assembly pilin Flp